MKTYHHDFVTNMWKEQVLSADPADEVIAYTADYKILNSFSLNIVVIYIHFHNHSGALKNLKHKSKTQSFN